MSTCKALVTGCICSDQTQPSQCVDTVEMPKQHRGVCQKKAEPGSHDIIRQGAVFLLFTLRLLRQKIKYFPLQWVFSFVLVSDKPKNVLICSYNCTSWIVCLTKQHAPTNTAPTVLTQGCFLNAAFELWLLDTQWFICILDLRRSN